MKKLMAAGALLLMTLCGAYGQASVKRLWQESADSATFCQDFPWQAHLQTGILQNYTAMEAQRHFLDSAAQLGDWYLETLFETYTRQLAGPLTNTQQVQQQLETGQRFLTIGQLLPEAHYMFEAGGDILLSNLKNRLDSALEAGTVQKSSEEVQYLIKRLGHLQYNVKVPVANYEKFWYHVQEGNFGYIWKRIRYRYLPEFLGLVAILIVVLATLLFRFFKKRNIKLSQKP